VDTSPFLKTRSSSVSAITAARCGHLNLQNRDSGRCRNRSIGEKIPIALVGDQKGETKAQACEIA
jgi:hypothetical protein